MWIILQSSDVSIIKNSTFIKKIQNKIVHKWFGKIPLHNVYINIHVFHWPFQRLACCSWECYLNQKLNVFDYFLINEFTSKNVLRL